MPTATRTGAGQGLDDRGTDKRVEIVIDCRVNMLIESQIDGRVVRLSNRKWNADMRNETVLTLYLHEPFSGAMLAGVPPCKGRVIYSIHERS